ncbi:7-deoxyloganetic acid glucosyltransferase-like [Diospyros lotus]|uniref:7-deoxyloganetic acid glucosyltransferase-like n=1 Tax=Diospyros lotus TaxID=55363 RepID=UPI0022523B14|nr:7-deoxyloganetic acid glucosyltransferase-like [Diospyros lotus]
MESSPQTHLHLLLPHVLIFPIPVQGHVNSMLRLAELLCAANLRVTFLISDFALARLQAHSNAQSRLSLYPDFSFTTISDGLPADHPRAGDRAMEVVMSLRETGRAKLREIMMRLLPVTCVIGDGGYSFAADVADEFGIPFMSFRTVGTCCFWAHFCVPDIIQAGELPFNGSSDYEMDLPVTTVPGMEGFLRRRDLPGFCRTEDPSDPLLQYIQFETRQSTRAKAVILNTFEDLEGPILSQTRSQIPNLFTIGPLHSHLKARLDGAATPQSSTSFWEEDWSCMKWLDAQPPKSVLYVSFGSITVLTKDQFMEFWHGLVNSRQRFLWVIRPESVSGGGQGNIPAELLEGTRERGCMVGWAPQEAVLSHQAVGGFWTHSGWNSTMESIAAGVPMICWPYFADQMINSRFVGEVWKLGLDMKDLCDREVVEKMIRDLMEVRKEEFVESANRMAELARKAIGDGGSSFRNLDRLVEAIRSLAFRA